LFVLDHFRIRESNHVEQLLVPQKQFRAPDAGTERAYLWALAHGLRDEGLLAGILGSPAYREQL
jgi:hypothetical protein